jgi:hypothetical protein
MYTLKVYDSDARTFATEKTRADEDESSARESIIHNQSSIIDAHEHPIELPQLKHL